MPGIYITAIHIVFRYAVNQNNYAVLEDCKNIATLTSTVKLFLREMPESLINREMVNYVKSSKIDLTGKSDHKNLISQLKESLRKIDKTSYGVLNFLLAHAKRVADEEGNFIMDKILFQCNYQIKLNTISLLILCVQFIF